MGGVFRSTIYHLDFSHPLTSYTPPPIHGTTRSLRIFFLLNRPPGAEAHTVLVQDIPGVAFGTVAHRTDATLLRFLPRRECSRGACLHVGTAGVHVSV